MSFLFERDVSRLGRPPGEPCSDRVPEWVAGGSPEPLRGDLERLLGPESVLTRAVDLVRYASDASPYRMLPQAIVLPRGIDDVQTVLSYCRTAQVPVCFRGAGTSLSGQAQTNGVLIDVRRHWAGMVVEDNGVRLRIRPGTVINHANQVLARYGRRLGPDPASGNAATIGGVIANNSGGMRCTLERDAYHTVRSMTLVLASGTVVDTAAPDAERLFAAREPNLARGLLQLRAELLADRELADRVRQKFRIRNTTGYRLISLLDAETPLEIFRRLVIGSEGTLAFVAEAVFDTLPAPPEATIAWIHTHSLEAAAALVPGLVGEGAEAVELLVASTLIEAQRTWPGVPTMWAELPSDSAVLLVEFTGENEVDLDDAERRARMVLKDHTLLRPANFIRDREAIALAWAVRGGMLGLGGMARPQGAALITEDVCFPPDRVAEGTRDLQALLVRHGFLPEVAGHASLGNLHFLLTPAFGQDGECERYAAFMTELVELVVDTYDGSLKAEHGTGVNMAPFVTREWGVKATEMMWRIKQLADPDGILAPEVVLSREPQVNLRNLKSTPPIEPVADKCIECGMCEVACPSRNLTATPRQRIVVRREMGRQPEGSLVLRALQEQFEYVGVQSCVADGACQSRCPVQIDTGKLIVDLRAREHTERAEAVALWLARNGVLTERLVRGLLRSAGVLASLVGESTVRRTAALLRRALSPELVPAWPSMMPSPAARRLPRSRSTDAVAVYFPACVNRIIGRSPGTEHGPSLPEALVAVSQRADAPLWIPEDVAGMCCSMPWSSKGYRRGQKHMANAVADALWRWSRQGELPVVIDAASCSYCLLNDVGGQLTGERSDRFASIRVQDAISWIHDQVLPRLKISKRIESLALHPPCSAERMKLNARLESIAGALAEEVTIPRGTGCCGMAGDRGLLHPELPATALREVKAELEQRDYAAYISANRTCEMGLHQITGKPYRSFVLMLEELTR
jgi:D-lactate dehydrogenase